MTVYVLKQKIRDVSKKKRKSIGRITILAWGVFLLLHPPGLIRPSLTEVILLCCVALPITCYIFWWCLK